MTDGPWDSYDRGKLRAGWSYPVGRTIVEEAVRSARVHLLSLDFSVPAGGTEAGLLLVRAARYRDLGNTYYLARGTPGNSRCVLHIYAVPSEVRAEARAMLTTGGGLERACKWLAATDSADPTWHDKSRRWEAYLIDGGLREAEAVG
ncbi:hypothetical protein AB0J83_19930 [Actinoplanes sp. NPDC049596]|uniref:hypothetical protein n=1 Tax=unclassified Actinoplanes TaxID=2626549 RepID=UPI0034292B7F